LSDWLALATAGLNFTIICSLQLRELKRGISGCPGKPALQRLCGT
jgi:hypothetical protein